MTLVGLILIFHFPGLTYSIGSDSLGLSGTEGSSLLPRLALLAVLSIPGLRPGSLLQHHLSLLSKGTGHSAETTGL